MTEEKKCAGHIVKICEAKCWKNPFIMQATLSATLLLLMLQLSNSEVVCEETPQQKRVLLK